jgi:hypothetical protein
MRAALGIIGLCGLSPVLWLACGGPEDASERIGGADAVEMPGHRDVADLGEVSGDFTDSAGVARDTGATEPGDVREDIESDEAPCGDCLDLRTEEGEDSGDAALLDGAILGDTSVDGGNEGRDVADGGPEDLHVGDAASCSSTCDELGLIECREGAERGCHQTEGGCLAWGDWHPCPEGCGPSGGCASGCGETCEPFSVILLPDTQYYTSRQAAGPHNTYLRQARWIVEHAESDNIAFVIHMGDLTNDNTPAQWEIASEAHRLLDDAGIPYSVMPGNHDYHVNGHDFDRGGSLFDTYFGPSRFAGRGWYGGGRGSSNESNVTLFEVGRLKFMVLSVEYAPRQETLCWANDVIARHPDRRVIIATHCYLTRGGNYAGNCPDVDYAMTGGAGRDVWEQLASRHSNVFMVVSGHIGESAHVPRAGVFGNIVHQMVVDYQFEAPCGAAAPEQCTNACWSGTHTGNGWMRKLVFDPRSNIVRASTFSVDAGRRDVFPQGEPTLFCSPLFRGSASSKGGDWYGASPGDVDHAFEFEYDMENEPEYRFDEVGPGAFIDRTINAIAAGDQAKPKVALDDTGRAVFVWEDDAARASGVDVIGRGLDATGCGAFSDTVIAGEPGYQGAPALGSDRAGGFVVVWEDDEDLNGVHQIRARTFASDGSERIARFTVNSEAKGDQRRPAVAVGPDGAFIVAWEDDQDGDGQSRIMVRGFFADGRERFADRFVDEVITGTRGRPAVAVDEAGRSVVVWEDDADGNGVRQIRARRFGPAGEGLGATFTVNQVATGDQRVPAVAMGRGGDFVIVWEDDPTMSGGAAVVGRGFRADGTGWLADFPISEAGGTGFGPVVAMRDDGGFGVSWTDVRDGDGDAEVRAELYLADGRVAKAEWTVNRVAAGAQRAPSVGLASMGTVVFVWEDDMDDNGSLQLVGRGVSWPLSP